LFYAPYYQGSNNKAAEDRKNNFSGMVYAPFVVHRLLEGALAKINAMSVFGSRTEMKRCMTNL